MAPTDTSAGRRAATPATPAGTEVVIREARRRQRRRWLAGMSAAAVAVAAVALLATSGPGTPGPAGRSHARSGPAPGVPHRTTPAVVPGTVEPERPGPLAAGPDGRLYMVDQLRDQILQLLPDGRFRMAVGDGTLGFSGDGGPATKARINGPGGMVVAPDGTLYFADTGNDRVRAVSPSGTITTVAGDGVAGTVADGTAALAAPLQPLAVTIGPDGDLYVASGTQVLRDEGGTLTCVVGCTSPYQGLYGIGGPATAGSADGPDGLALDPAGDLFIAGDNTKSILMVDPAGRLRLIGSAYPRGDGGLVTAADGTVLAMDELGVDRLTPSGIQAVVHFPAGYRVPHTFAGVTNFSPDGIAVGPGGAVYVDTFYGNGYSDQSALVLLRPDGRPVLLWHRRGSPGT